MADKIGIALTGDKELKRLIALLPGKVQKNALRKGLRGGMKPIASSIRSMAEKGEIRSSLSRKAKSYGKDGTLALFYGTKGGVRTEKGELVANIAHDKEFGTIDTPPAPFIRPGFESARQSGLSSLKSELGKAVRDEALKLGKR